MNDQPNQLEDRLESLTQWRTDHDVTLWEAALDQASGPRAECQRKLRMPSRVVVGIAAMVVLAAVGAWASMGMLGQARSQAPVMAYARQMPSEMAPSSEMDYAEAHREYSVAESSPASEMQPRAIQRSAGMELTTDAVRPLFDRITALVDSSLGEYVEAASANEDHADVKLRVSAQRLEAVMRAIRQMDGVAEVHREESSAVDATDRRADLTARLTNERRIEAELLDLLQARPDAPLGDVLRVREALSEVRLNIERLDAQRATLSERVALATLRVSIARISEEPEPAEGASGFLHDLSDAISRGGRTLADSTAWIVEAVIGGLIVWIALAVFGVWGYRTLRWRATWA